MSRAFGSDPKGYRFESCGRYHVGAFSSVGYGSRLITGRSGVRVSEGPPSFQKDDIAKNDNRGVAQFGSARGLGPWGREFESLHLDH